MLYIRKLYPLPEVIDQINKIKRSDEWRRIPEDDTNAIREQFNLISKSGLRHTLIKEQHGLCAYCMKRIDNDDKTTIEHWTPLSKSKDKAIAYTNMLGVCHGGRKTKTDVQRILCCDASKDEDEIQISPWNEAHMKDIAYNSKGIIYTLSGNVKHEEDINDRLCLNGVKDKNGNCIDTSTEIIKGRRDAIQWCYDFYRRLDKDGKCTSLMVKKKSMKLNRPKLCRNMQALSFFI